MGKVIPLRLSKQASVEPKESAVCSSEIVQALAAVRKTLRRIRQNGSRENEIHVLGTDLLHLLALVQREPKVESAIDELYEAARLLVQRSKSGGAPDAKQLQRLSEAHRHLEITFAAARPREL